MDTRNQANPWICERSLGGVGIALQFAEQTGVIRKVYCTNYLHAHFCAHNLLWRHII